MKKRCIKYGIVGIATVLILFVSGIAVHAEDGAGEDGAVGSTIENILNEQMNASGADDLYEHIPSETQRYLRELGFDELSLSTILNMNVGEVLSLVGKMALDYFRSMGQVLFAIIGVIFISVLMDLFKDHFSGQSVAQVFHLISLLCLAAIVVTPILSTVTRVVEAIQNGTNFITALIPVLAGIMLSGGQIATSSTYSVVMYSVTQVVSNISSTLIVPLVTIYLAFSIISAISPNLNLEEAAKGIKKVASWILGFVITIFIALLSAQTMITSSADTVTAKAGKFIVGSFVPVVGSALSDAVATVQGCLGLLRNVVGVFGIVSALFIFLPTLLECLLWVGILSLAAVASDLFSVSMISKLLRSIAGALSLLCSILISSGVLLIVSTSMVLLIGKGGAA